MPPKTKTHESVHEDPFLKKERELEDLRKQVELLTNQIGYLKEDLQKYKNENNDLILKLRTEQESSNRVLVQISQLREQNKKAEQPNEIERKLRNQIKGKDEEIKRLRDELDDSIKREKQLNLDIKKNSEENLLLKQQIDQLNTALTQHSLAAQANIPPSVEKEAEIRPAAISTSTPNTVSSSLDESTAALSTLMSLYHQQIEPLTNIISHNEVVITNLKTQVNKLEQKLKIEIDAKRSQEEKIQSLQRDMQTSRGEQEQLTQKYEETQAHLEEEMNQMHHANQTIEDRNLEISRLRSQIEHEKQMAASEWARGLGVILSDLSALTLKGEPDPDRGLTPRAVFEAMKSWMEKVFNEKLRPFPTSKELSNDDHGHPWIHLDADEIGLEPLLGLYDWGHESPFANLSEGNRKIDMRIQRWGWRAGKSVIVKSKVTALQSDAESEA